MVKDGNKETKIFNGNIVIVTRHRTKGSYYKGQKSQTFYTWIAKLVDGSVHNGTGGMKEALSFIEKKGE